MLKTTNFDPAIVFKSTRRSPDAIEWLSQVHDAAEAAGFTVPRLIPSNNGNLSENGWTAEPFLPGTPLASDDLQQLAPMLARFHQAAAHLPQRPGFLSARALVTAPHGGDIDFQEMPPDLVAACKSAFAALDHTPETIIHGDITPLNTIVLPDGRIGLLDWDEARRDLPLFDLGNFTEPTTTETRAQLAWEVACCWSIEPDRAARLGKKLLTMGKL